MEEAKAQRLNGSTVQRFNGAMVKRAKDHLLA